jgi:hypothetical protein
MKLAMGLLRIFDVPSRNEALIGDLAEERAAGRSLTWLWGQTFAAIGNTVARKFCNRTERPRFVLALSATVGCLHFSAIGLADVSWEQGNLTRTEAKAPLFRVSFTGS